MKREQGALSAICYGKALWDIVALLIIAQWVQDQLGYAQRTNMLPLNFNFYVCGKDELCYHENKELTHFIGFTHPNNDDVADYSNFRLKPTVFVAHDVFDNRYDKYGIQLVWPDKQLIEDIIQVGISIKKELLKQNPVTLLIHCQAGISRSTAAAYIILNVILGEWNERGALAELMSRRNIARPNPLMVTLADQLLNRKYKMIAPLKNCVDWNRGREDNQSPLLF